MSPWTSKDCLGEEDVVKLMKKAKGQLSKGQEQCLCMLKGGWTRRVVGIGVLGIRRAAGVKSRVAGLKGWWLGARNFSAAAFPPEPPWLGGT